MTDENEPTADEHPELVDVGSRRQFLQAMGAASGVAGLVGSAGAQETATETTGTETPTPNGTPTTDAGEATSIVLGGREAYWLGLSPTAIEGQQNPALALRTGERYRLVWVNLDGERHRWQLLDGDGNVLEQTDPATQVGVTRSVTFEATESMSQYRCEYHPEEMQGDVTLGTGFETATNGESPTTDGATATDGETATADGEETTDGGTTVGDGETATGDGETVDVAAGPEGNTLRFVPEEVEIATGDTVRWTAESPGHNVSCKPEADRRVQLPEGAEPFASYEGNRSFAIMPVGETFEHTFTVPGTYVYVCVPHADQGMIGRVVVSE